MFPNTYFPNTYFTGNYFPPNALIVVVEAGGGGTRVLRRKLEQKFPHDADIIELIIILHEDSYGKFS